MSGQLATHVAGLFVQVRPTEGARLADAAFADFYASAFPKVYGFVRSQVNDAAIAEEIIGRVFLKAYRNRDKVTVDDSAISWLFRIAWTTLIDYWRVEARRRAANVPIEELEDICDSASNPEMSYWRLERHAILLKAVATLGADDRALLALKFVAQRTNREIAEILGLSAGAVSMRLLRALRRVRRCLSAAGVS